MRVVADLYYIVYKALNGRFRLPHIVHHAFSVVYNFYDSLLFHQLRSNHMSLSAGCLTCCSGVFR